MFSLSSNDFSQHPIRRGACISLLALLTILLLLAGCGEESKPSAPVVTPPGQKMAGTYQLSRFTITTTSGTQVITQTEKDFPGYLGVIKVSDATMYYHTNINQVSTEITYSFQKISDGLIMLGSLGTPPSSPVNIRIDGMDMVFGENATTVTTSGTVQQVFVWTKTSDLY